MNTSEYLTNFVSLTFAEEVVLVCGEGRFDSVKKTRRLSGKSNKSREQKRRKILIKKQN